MSTYYTGFEDAVLGLFDMEKTAARTSYLKSILRKAGKEPVKKAISATPRSALRKRRMAQAPAPSAGAGRGGSVNKAPKTKAPAPSGTADAASTPVKKTLRERMRGPGMLAGGLGLAGGAGYMAANLDTKNQQRQQYPMAYNY